MDMGIAGKVALVAASSKGIGYASARLLAAEGARLVMCARDTDTLSAAAGTIRDETGAEVLPVPADMTRPEDIERLAGEANGRFGTVDILVNNAGGPPPGYFMDISDEDWRAAHELSLMSSVRLTRLLLPAMREQRYGRIINITSVSVKQPIDHLLLSNSVRMAVVGWAKTLSNQIAAEGITINNVCPGWTLTDRVGSLLKARSEKEGITVGEAEQTISSTIPMRRLGTAEELGSLVVYLASSHAAYMTGTSIQVDGGLTAGYS